MAGLNLNIGSSVVKREAKPIEEVADKFASDGWSQTGSLMGGNVLYFEKSGVNVTLIGGPGGTVVVPSGPLRGGFFGMDAVGVNQTSVVGLGASSSEEDPRTAQTRGEHT